MISEDVGDDGGDDGDDGGDDGGDGGDDGDDDGGDGDGVIPLLDMVECPTIPTLKRLSGSVWLRLTFT